MTNLTEVDCKNILSPIPSCLQCFPVPNRANWPNSELAPPAAAAVKSGHCGACSGRWRGAEKVRPVSAGRAGPQHQLVWREAFPAIIGAPELSRKLWETPNKNPGPGDQG